MNVEPDPEDGFLLSRLYVRQKPVFWHEEIARLTG
jgi:hypothetical protein